jgi:hypothetical protein
MRALLAIAVLVAGASTALVGAQGRARVATEYTCAAGLGNGVKTKREFCDVITGGAPADSVAVPVPAHTGTATLLFDLHNRFGVPVISGYPGASYARHDAVVAVIGADGAVLARAAVIREFRTTADLFDQLAGGTRPGGVKAVAPGPPEAIRLTLPAGVEVVGIVGESLRVRTATGADDTYDAPGRPVAIVSNLRLEYRSR